MAFKLFVLAAALAVAHAGGPAAYSINTATADFGSLGSTQESTLKGIGGNNVITQYSKAVDSPYSSVRISNSRVSNDAFAYGAGYGYAAPAPAGLTYGAAGQSFGTSLHGHAAYGATRLAAPAIAAAPALAYGGYARAAYAAPALAYGGYARAAYAAPAIAAAPALAYGHGLARAAIAAPAVAYSAAPAVAHVSYAGLGAHYAF
ncbi:cuticle protein 21.3-like [Anabrus simplex]|uniref:cuticle protein 21.3-like n=1 Tax=Anabrus simplex TaxID=316456 RepID=UPI0035A2ADE9